MDYVQINVGMNFWDWIFKMNIEQAIEVLRKRGFEVKDYSQVIYRVTDEGIDWLVRTDEELIQYAQDQERELEGDVK